MPSRCQVCLNLCSFPGIENTFDRDLIASAEIAAGIGAILSHNGPSAA